MTPGTMLFFAGAGFLVLALLLTLFMVLTGRGRKRRLEERLRQRY